MEYHVTFTGATDTLFSKVQLLCRRQKETQMESYSRLVTKKENNGLKLWKEEITKDGK